MGKISKLNSFRTSEWGVILFYSYLVAIIIAGIVIGWGVVYIVNLANDNRRALCSLKTGYQQQLKQTQKFQRTHPKGAPSLGFTPADIQVQIDGLTKRVESLSDIHCK